MAFSFVNRKVKSEAKDVFWEFGSEFSCGESTEVIQKDDLDQLEIEEEVNLLNNLRIQRQKIEEFQMEVYKKDLRIRDLEEKLTYLQNTSNEDFDHEFLLKELKEKEEVNLTLQTQLKKQVDEYEFSLKELKKAAIRAQEEKNREIRSLKYKIQQQEKAFEDLTETVVNLTQKLKQTECQLEGADSRDSETIGWASIENETNFRVSAVLTENFKLSEKCSQLKQQLEHEKMKKKTDLKHLQKEEELELWKKSHEEFVKRTEFEIGGLKSDLARAVGVVKRQENTIAELRKRGCEDELVIAGLKDIIQAKENELMSVCEFNKGEWKGNKENSDSCKGDRMGLLKQENKDLKIKVLKMKNKEECLKMERKKVAQLKMEMISQRSAEVSKMTDALDAISKKSKF